MAEPQASAAALAAAAISPFLGQYPAIVFAALAGGLWALSGAETLTRIEGAKLLFRLVLTAVALTSAVCWLLQSHIPQATAVSPVAFLIAGLGNRWQSLFNALGDGIAKFLTSLGGRQ